MESCDERFVKYVKYCVMLCSLKVVDFLNDLYTTFDSVIDMFDVYKVGLPSRSFGVVSSSLILQCFYRASA